MDMRKGTYTRTEKTKGRTSKSLKKRFENPKNHPRWKGGISPYPSEFYRIRENIRERDNHTCRLCGKKQGTRKLDVHHIDYDRKNSDPKNLITLCTSCNMKAESNKRFWTRVFKQFIGRVRYEM